MRPLILASALLAAAVLTPNSASAQRWRYHVPDYYQGYNSTYMPAHMYDAPIQDAYTVWPSAYGYPGASYYSPLAPNYQPIYSGPQYFQNYGAPRLLVYPDHVGPR
ncbi:MAG TPA: hypothetical protein VMS17_11415 [Gemmataceae bacterium]|nr:hypothetical protein [Gemmataceae bacterium]